MEDDHGLIVRLWLWPGEVVHLRAEVTKNVCRSRVRARAKRIDDAGHTEALPVWRLGLVEAIAEADQHVARPKLHRALCHIEFLQDPEREPVARQELHLS